MMNSPAGINRISEPSRGFVHVLEGGIREAKQNQLCIRLIYFSSDGKIFWAMEFA
jgi:hypothetical protein